MQVDGHGGRGAPEDYSDLLGAALLEVIEGDGLGLAGRQPPHRLPEGSVGRFKVLDRAYRADRQPAQGTGFDGPSTAGRDGGVGHHPADKGVGAVVPAHLLPALVGGEKGILGQVFGRRPPATKGVCEGHHSRVLSAVKGVEILCPGGFRQRRPRIYRHGRDRLRHRPGRSTGWRLDGHLHIS